MLSCVVAQHRQDLVHRAPSRHRPADRLDQAALDESADGAPGGPEAAVAFQGEQLVAGHGLPRALAGVPGERDQDAELAVGEVGAVVEDFIDEQPAHYCSPARPAATCGNMETTSGR